MEIHPFSIKRLKMSLFFLPANYNNETVSWTALESQGS